MVALEADLIVEAGVIVRGGYAHVVRQAAVELDGDVTRAAVDLDGEEGGVHALDHHGPAAARGPAEHVDLQAQALEALKRTEDAQSVLGRVEVGADVVGPGRADEADRPVDDQRLRDDERALEAHFGEGRHLRQGGLKGRRVAGQGRPVEHREWSRRRCSDRRTGALAGRHADRGDQGIASAQHESISGQVGAETRLKLGRCRGQPASRTGCLVTVAAVRMRLEGAGSEVVVRRADRRGSKRREVEAGWRAVKGQIERKRQRECVRSQQCSTDQHHTTQTPMLEDRQKNSGLAPAKAEIVLKFWSTRVIRLLFDRGFAEGYHETPVFRW